MMVAAVLVTALVLAVPVYFHWGWSRMADECDFGTPSSPAQTQIPFDSADSKSVAFSWRWSGGFTCTYNDGTTRSSYWY
jgi:hypothetical protein